MIQVSFHKEFLSSDMNKKVTDVLTLRPKAYFQIFMSSWLTDELTWLTNQWTDLLLRSDWSFFKSTYLYQSISTQLKN